MADLSDDDIATLWAMACERERPTREMVRAFAHAVLAADRALNAPQAAPVAQAERAGWREVMQRLITGIDHLSEIARQWEPDYSSGQDRRGWVLATDARDEAARLLAATTPDQTKG